MVVSKNTNRIRVAALGGDGIGPEVIDEAAAVLDLVAARTGLGLDLERHEYGAAAYHKTGAMLPEATWKAMELSDAILFGAIGGVEYEELPRQVREQGSLLRIRREFRLYANLRPVKPIKALYDASTLKPEVIDGVDLLILRELNGGVYFGEPRGIETVADGSKRGFDTQVYTTAEIERVARAAFMLARQRRGHVTSVEKSNVMRSGVLWREVVTAVHAREFADVKLEHMYADNCAMQLIRNPRQFDVVVTDNLFGDILSDAAAMITGSLGMLPSASLDLGDGAGRILKALYEPVHGSAPDIAGRGIANPLAAILSAAMLLRHTAEREDLAAAVEGAVADALAAGARTGDIAAKGEATISTREMGKAVREALERRLKG